MINYKLSITSLCLLVITIFLISCGRNNSVFVGRWGLIEEGNTDMPFYIELLKDGTGFAFNHSITWKTENNRLFITHPYIAFAFDYKISNSRVTLTDNSGNASVYMKITELSSGLGKEIQTDITISIIGIIIGIFFFLIGGGIGILKQNILLIIIFTGLSSIFLGILTFILQNYLLQVNLIIHNIYAIIIVIFYLLLIIGFTSEKGIGFTILFFVIISVIGIITFYVSSFFFPSQLTITVEKILKGYSTNSVKYILGKYIIFGLSSLLVWIIEFLFILIFWNIIIKNNDLSPRNLINKIFNK